MNDILKESYFSFFPILCSSLWGHSFQKALTSKQFLHVMALAEEQTVFGLVFDVLKDVQIDGLTDRSVIYTSVGRSEVIKQQNLVLNKELVWFAGKIEEGGLDCLVVKGQTIAQLYQKPELRQSGDIDFLLPTDLGYNLNLNRIFPDAGITERLSEKEFGFDHNNTRYELHIRLLDFGCKKHQKLWDTIEASELSHGKYGKDNGYFVDVDGMKVRTLSPTTNAAYVFLHLYFHLMREGVSIRQFCDWTMVLHHYHDEIDRQQLTDIITKLDMLNAYKAFGCIVVDELGLPEKEFPMELTDNDRQWKDKILYDIFRGGNFGKQNHKAKSAFGYKMETLRLAVRNSIRYYRLAPS